MAISTSFNGSVIFKPGSYSQTVIDLGGGFPLSPTGLIAIMGEAVSGAPGSTVPNIQNNVFTPDEMPLIRQTYRSGPLVDACNFLFAPGADGAIPGGAQAVYIYKTNASVRATLALANTWGTLTALEWGTGGNRLTYTNSLVAATSATIASTTTFDLTGSPLTGKVFTLRVNGGALASNNGFTCPAAISTAAGLTSALGNLANWSLGSVPTDVTFTVGGVDAAATLTVSRIATGNPQREGGGRNFALTDGAGNFLLACHLPVVGSNGEVTASSTEDMAVVTLNNKRDLITETGTLGGNVVLKIGRKQASSATVTITATQILLNSGGSPEYTLNKADFDTIQQVADFISTSTATNWNAVVTSTLWGQFPPSVLDQVTTLGANCAATTPSPAKQFLPALIKKDASEVAAFFAQSSMMSLVAGASAVCGLPDADALQYLTGGAAGATLTSDVTNALTAFQKVRVNSVVPLFSRDATADKTDGLTDTGSNYTISGIHQGVKTHCSLMATVKARSERQGYLSLKDTYLNSKLESQTMADARQQLLIQDVKQADSQGVIKWFQPWALACMLAGARGGSPVGLPMTNKFLNVSGIRQTAQAMTVADASIVEDFNPDTQYDDAIQNGITFLEHPQTGGFRVVVDNTTYGRDGNFVYNRAHVLYAADIISFDFRTQMQNIYVGVKNTVSAAEVAETAKSILGTYLAQGLTVSTSDAKAGFKQLLLQLNGNTINISVTVKIVEGIDFVLETISLQRASSST